MIGLLQRVSQASVSVGGTTIARIDTGILAMIGVQPADGVREAERLVERLLGYRVFADGEGRMNRSLGETGGGLLLVPQFTLAADTRKGMRASFASAAAPPHGEALFAQVVAAARARHRGVSAGRFGADMQVALVNEGPVTFWLEVLPR